jgi:hypothetical protein
MAVVPFRAWIYVEPKSELEKNVTKVKKKEIYFHTEELLHVMLKHMYDTSGFLPSCLNSGKLSSQ